MAGRFEVKVNHNDREYVLVVMPIHGIVRVCSMWNNHGEDEYNRMEEILSFITDRGDNHRITTRVEACTPKQARLVADAFNLVADYLDGKIVIETPE